MKDEQVNLVRETFAMVSPIAEAAAGLFYGKLFELDPNLAPLFKGADMKEQGRKLMAMLAMVVAGLDRFDALRPAVANLGARHVEYHVRPEDYNTVGAALLWTLETGLGEAYTPAVAEAWTAAYTALSGVMLEAHEASVIGA
ncbi:MAG TPA: globin family protein [Candidatus Kapabacteria bacterium]|nr:globin family protein [Candidatus Kapabacteria bacterium]